MKIPRRTSSVMINVSPKGKVRVALKIFRAHIPKTIPPQKKESPIIPKNCKGRENSISLIMLSSKPAPENMATPPPSADTRKIG